MTWLRTRALDVVRLVRGVYGARCASLGIDADALVSETWMQLDKREREGKGYDPARGAWSGYVCAVARTALTKMERAHRMRVRIADDLRRMPEPEQDRDTDDQDELDVLPLLLETLTIEAVRRYRERHEIGEKTLGAVLIALPALARGETQRDIAARADVSERALASGMRWLRSWARAEVAWIFARE